MIKLTKQVLENVTTDSCDMLLLLSNTAFGDDAFWNWFTYLTSWTLIIGIDTEYFDCIVMLPCTMRKRFLISKKTAYIHGISSKIEKKSGTIKQTDDIITAIVINGCVDRELHTEYTTIKENTIAVPIIIKIHTNDNDNGNVILVSKIYYK